MTDREDMIKLLDNFNRNLSRYAGESKYVIVDDNCELVDHLLANGVTVQRWIPVTERLPGNEKVLITNGDIVMRGYRRPDGVWKYGVGLDEVWEKLSLRPVTHWMPLPELPKEGE